MEIKILYNLIKRLFTSALIFTLVFFILSAIIDIYYFNRVAHKDPGARGQICYSDFRVFWRASRNIYLDIAENKKLQAGHRTVYDKSQKFYHFRYSPLAAVIMIPFGMPRYPATGLILWYITLNLIFLAALFLLTKRLTRDFNLTIEHRYILLWGMFFLMLRFYLNNISLGQTDILVAFLFVLFLISYITKKEILSGITFALLLQFKLLFLPILVYFFLTRKMKIVASAVISFAAFLLIPALLVGWDKNIILLKEWNGILGMSLPSQILNYKNQSITYAICSFLLKINFIKESVMPKYIFYLFSALFTLAAYAATGFFIKKESYRNETAGKYIEVSLALVISLLFSPIVWLAHFMVLIIPVAVCILFTIKSEKQNILYVFWVIFIVLSCVVGTDFTKFIPVINKLRFINVALGTVFLASGMIYAFLTIPPDFKNSA